MAEFAYTQALDVLCGDASPDLGPLLAAACGTGGDPVVYLADFARQVLLPLAPGVPREPVTGTLAGRVFTTGQPAVSGADGGPVRALVPVREQTARIGVLAVTLPDPGPQAVRQAEMLGVFAGLLVAGLALVSDAPRVRRQGRRMSLPASMQWDLLPPWALHVPGAMAAGILEPAYDIAGDAFDYAAGDGVLQFAIIDGMGHGLGSTQLAGLAVGAYRHARRAGASLAEMHATVDEAMASDYDDLSFATGILGTLATGTGRLEWTCAGHPPPLLLRGRKVTGELQAPAMLPFGLGGGPAVMNARDLEPGDEVLLYTDGVTDAHQARGDLFGLDRLIDLLEREAAADLEPEETLRRLVQALLAYQGGGLRDDATLLLLRWAGRG
jgi:Stage II sporulation protein E (SpoIIE)